MTAPSSPPPCAPFPRGGMRLGISHRLILWFLGISLVPIALLLLLSQQMAETLLRQNEMTHLASIAEAKSLQIANLVEDNEITLTAQMRAPQMADTLAALQARPAPSGGGDPFQLASLLQPSGYRDFVLFSPQGRVLFSTGPRFHPGQSLDAPPLRQSALAEAVRQSLGSLQAAFAPFDPAPPDEDPPLFVVAPVVRNGVLRGVGAAELNAGPFLAALSDRVGLGRSGGTLLGQRTARGIMILLAPRSEGAPAPHRLLPETADHRLRPVDRALAGENGEGESLDSQGRPVLAAWRAIPALRWGLVVKIGRKEALTLVERQRQLVLAIALLTMAGVTLLALFAARSITRPIQELIVAARRMGGGELGRRVPVERQDELGELAQAFNRMAYDLRHAYDGVEAEVRRRTLQLESSNLALERARDELRKFHQAVESSSLAVIISNHDGLVEYVNPRLCATTGYSLDEMLGRPQQTCWGDDDTPMTQALRQVMRSGEDWHGEFQALRKDGSRYWVLAFISPVRQAGGAITHYLSILEDISRRKQDEEQLTATKNAAEAANRAKSEFLAVMSHEIRTPMNGILGMAQLVLDSPLSPQQRDYAETIFSSSEALLGLLNDILDFSKLEAGKIEFESVMFDLGDVAAAVMGLMAPRAREKNLHLDTDLPGDLPCGLRGDPLRLRQILLNLVGNAIKFTDQGAVRLSIRALAVTDQTAELHFAVSDTGIGIPPHMRQKLFHSFSQADTSINRRYGGSGLGLAICRRLVERQGGRIGVDSEDGAGSTFWFRLGYAIARSERPPPTAAAAAGLPPLKILLAEDNAVNRKVAMALLERGGHRVEAVVNGHEAVKAAGSAVFDLILMDMQMPEMDGLEATGRIRGLPGRHGQVPIIALTANAMPGDEQQCLAAGMNGYVSKPIEQGRLFAEMQRVYSNR